MAEEVKRCLAEENKEWLQDDIFSAVSSSRCNYKFWDYSGDTLHLLIHQVDKVKTHLKCNRSFCRF